MKTLTDIPTSKLAELLGSLNSYASNMKAGRVKPSAKIAQKINAAFGVTLYELRPDIYPRHLFEANDASNSKQQPQSINEGVHG
jgi:DNA-binding transcriptional regulator YdaS (Cro superfamily)